MRWRGQKLDKNRFEALHSPHLEALQTLQREVNS
jgi:hypothetical protein